MSLTTNPNDPCLKHGQQETGQNNCYLVLSEEELAKGFIRPVRDKYVHVGGCGVETKMNMTISETYARDPKFYNATYCTGCGTHLPVGEFQWSADGQILGS